VNVSITVTWEDGQVTRHEICGLPDLSREVLAELLERDLASYVDDDELPTSAEGLALGWVAVELATP
jgi:hypothetical protein